MEEVRFYFCRFAAGGNDALSLAREKSISGTHAGEIVVWQGLFWKAAPEFSVSSLRLILSSSGPKQRPVSGVCFLLKLSPSEPAQSAVGQHGCVFPGQRESVNKRPVPVRYWVGERTLLCVLGDYIFVDLGGPRASSKQPITFPSFSGLLMDSPPDLYPLFPQAGLTGLSGQALSLHVLLLLHTCSPPPAPPNVVLRLGKEGC